MYVGVRVRGGWAYQAGASPTRSVSVCGPQSHWRQSPEPRGPVRAENRPSLGPFSHSSWPLFVRLCGDPSCFRETLWETERSKQEPRAILYIKRRGDESPGLTWGSPALQRGAWERAVDIKKKRQTSLPPSPPHNCFARAKMYRVRK